MSVVKDPFASRASEDGGDFNALSRKPLLAWPAAEWPAAVTARVHGFTLDDQPLLSNLAAAPGEIVTARTTISLRQSDVGADVVLLFEHADPRRPIIVGRIGPAGDAADQNAGAVSVRADDDRLVVIAEREIVLRCGDASITLTRAGKVIIKGEYVLSESTGYNKIKGAVVDIN
jgi:hypothetical protein